MNDEEWVFEERIPGSWLQRRLTVEEAESENSHNGVIFGGCNKEWTALKSKMLEGDEIWEFFSCPESWGQLAGRAGIALVRHGSVIDCIVTIMN